jgi:aromatic-L-amino-acid decarboxylase
VNTGAFDNLLELFSIARAENLWFHVDGAFGGFVILDSHRRHLVAGIDQADSLAFDFHK